MAAVDFMRPTIQRIDEHLHAERDIAFNRLVSVYGPNYAEQKNLPSLLERLVEDDKISPSNTMPLEEGLTDKLSLKEKVKGTLKEFKGKCRNEIEKWSNNQPKEFIGRDVDQLDILLEKKAGVILYGAPGVGKTKLAKEFLIKRNYKKQIVVDLRGVTSIQIMCIETLRNFGKLVSTDDATTGLVVNVISKYVASQSIFLLFDNADEFVHFSGVGEDLTGGFSHLVKSILEESRGHLKMLITSRYRSDHPDADLFLHQEQLKSLKDEDASNILKSRMIHEKDKDSQTTNQIVLDAVKQCQNLPINLKILGAALQEQGVHLQDLLAVIVKRANEWKLMKEKENVELAAEESNTYGVLASRFERLSDTTQLAAVALSLFTRSFSFNSAFEVLKDYEKAKVHLILDYLKGTNFITLDTGSELEGERVYDMHPKVKEFLASKVSFSEAISDFYSRAKNRFITFFKDKLVSICKFIDNDYLKAYELYQDDSSNFEFIFKQRGNGMILIENYDDTQRVQMLLNGMLEPNMRQAYFKNLADTAFQHGKRILGSQYLCWSGLEEGFLNPIKALQYTVLRVKHNLKTIQGLGYITESRPVKELESLYTYTKGDLLYHVIHSNLSLEDCEVAIKALEKSIAIREQLHPSGHTDLARTYINIGNIYNIKEDIYRRKRMFNRLEDCLKMALTYYNKALAMRTELSTQLHLDSPQINQNIGTIYYEKGRLLMYDGEEDAAFPNFQTAEKFFKVALRMEEELKLDGLYGTSTKLINLGDLYKNMRDYEKAFDCFDQAATIRHALKGGHKDTVLAIYRKATTKHSMKKYREAVLCYEEAFEMEESLAPNFHSAIRTDIRMFLLKALETWAKRESDADEKKKIEVKKEEILSRIRLLDVEAKEREAGHSLASKESTSAGETKQSGESKMEIVREASSSDMFVNGHFDKSGGHIAFMYFNVYLTIPENLTDAPQEVKVFRRTSNDELIKLKLAEYLASGVFEINTVSLDDAPLKAPAMLEIQCEIMDSRIDSFSELCMIQYDAISKTWNDVEDISILHKRHYWYHRNEYVSVVQAWIKTFAMFALILRPKTHHLSLPATGRTWRSWQDERLSLQFRPESFQKPNVECSIKVATPPDDITSQVKEQSGILVTPAVNVNIGETILKPVRLTLPLLGIPDGVGEMRVLRKNDEIEAEWIIEALNPSQSDVFGDAAVIEVSTFSWLMVVWTPAKQIANFSIENIGWLARTLYEGFPCDVDFHLYRGIFHEDQRIIAIYCTPYTPNHAPATSLLKCPATANYIYVDCAPSQQRLRDAEFVRVDVRGQFINKSKPDEDTLKFNKTCPRLNKVSVKESGLDSGKGGDVAMYALKGPFLCSIPYLNDFMIQSDSLDELDEFRTRTPIRFLGLQLDHCGLENINIYACGFRNNLWKTGLSEDFIDELKLDTYVSGRTKVVKKLFQRITVKFVTETLLEGWFDVFREDLHPPPTRMNLISVMDLLEEKLWYTKIDVIECITNSVDVDWQRFCSLFLAKLTNTVVDVLSHQSSRDYLAIGLRMYIKSNGHVASMLNLIRCLLHFKKYGFPDEVDRILNCLGEYIEMLIKIQY